MKKKIFLIDGNSFCYRAFYAIRALSTSKGQPTNAVYGVVAMINKIIKSEKPDLFAVAFDLKGPTHRHEKYEKYKAHRKPMPDDLVSQMPVIKDVIRAYRIPIFELEGFEADDVLATLAKRAEKEGFEVFIVTGDKDALQLVDENIKVYNPQGDGLIYDEEAVKAKYGISPCQMTDLMSIMGDSSDNIPGILGIGEKGARELISEFGSLENLLQNIDKVKSVAKRKLIEEHKEEAVLSKDLATVVKDLELNVDFNELAVKGPDTDKLVDLFKELEFKALLKDLIPQGALKSEYSLIDSKSKMDALIGSLKKQKEFTLDLETTSADPMIARPVGISFSWEEERACYVPFNLSEEMSADKVLAAMRSVLEDDKVKKIGQNIKYDYIVLQNAGIKMKGISFDTMIASYLLNPSKPNHNLGDISIEYLNHRMQSIEGLIGKGKDVITMDQVEIEKVKNYSCEDSDVTFRLKRIFETALKEAGLDELFSNIEVPLLEVLAAMETAGVKVDTKYLEKISGEMEGSLKIHQKKIFEIAGEEFNVNSPKQLQKILFEKMKMPIVKRTKTGPSTDEEVLTQLAASYPLAAEILRFREFSKLKSTYVDALPGLINNNTGKIHTSFNQTVTATGRLSSSRPNLQNIPVKTDEGKKIRRAFIAEKKGHILLAADYSQIELRVLAHLSGDENLIRAFKEDKDIHKFTAALIYSLDEKDITDDMRSSAKTVNFGIVYGMGPFKLSKDLAITIDAAKSFIENYFSRYPGVKNYLDNKILEARKLKYVTTLMSRRRYVPEISSENIRIRNFAERTAVNTPIQGSAADIIKMAMINIHKELAGFRSMMIMQVHDELVFDVKEDELKKVALIVKSGMENVVKLDVPMKVHLEIGENWLDMEEYEA